MSQRSLALAAYAAVMAGLTVGLIAALITQALLADDARANLVGGLHAVALLFLGAGATALLVLHVRAPRQTPAVVRDEADEDTAPVGPGL
jgi:hypothetical protein